MSMMKLLPAVTAAAFLALSVGCGGSKQASSEGGEAAESKPAGAAYKPTGEEGTVTGKVEFKGQAPKFKALSMDADAVCAGKHKGPVMPEAVVVNGNGTLRNVLVYVKSGLEGKTFAPATDAVVLDQEGCMYKPHVVALQAGQPLRVETKDDTTHNIHPMPKVNREWNVSQPPKADAIAREFSRPEVSIPVKCNQHPWMRAYIHVLGHPYFAVTGDDGTFKIANLPPGNYELEAVQEQYGAQTQKLAVGPKETKTADFTFASTGQAYHAPSLKTMPAMVIECCQGK